MDRRPVVVVATVLLSPTGELLMGLRSDRLEWEVPGGKVDDETLAQAFVRELLEETGMRTDDAPSLLGISEPDPAEFKGVRYVIHFMLVRNYRGFAQRMEPDKCLAWRWFPLDKLPPAAKCTPGTRDFIKNIVPGLLEQQSEQQSDGPVSKLSTRSGPTPRVLR